MDNVDMYAERYEMKSVSELLFDALKPPTKEELERVLRPAPTNPQTWDDLQKPLIGE